MSKEEFIECLDNKFCGRCYNDNSYVNCDCTVEDLNDVEFYEITSTGYVEIMFVYYVGECYEKQYYDGKLKRFDIAYELSKNGGWFPASIGCHADKSFPKYFDSNDDSPQCKRSYYPEFFKEMDEKYPDAEGNIYYGYTAENGAKYIIVAKEKTYSSKEKALLDVRSLYIEYANVVFHTQHTTDLDYQIFFTKYKNMRTHSDNVVGKTGQKELLELIQSRINNPSLVSIPQCSEKQAKFVSSIMKVHVDEIKHFNKYQASEIISAYMENKKAMWDDEVIESQKKLDDTIEFYKKQI